LTTAPAQVASLSPLAYQAEVLSFLKTREPDVWAWASSLSVQEQHSEEVRAHLLRDTYRLMPASHAPIYALCQQALQRLQIDVPVTLYQASGSAMNATLYYLPGEAHIVLQGPVMERLQDNELLALLGHELAHYHLWSKYDGQYLVADRVLNHSSVAQSDSPSYSETARLYGLHTELYADRGAALVANCPEAAIAMLVKVHTGTTDVDVDAYLKQALEVDSREEQSSQGFSHPEFFMRSQAIDMWWRQDGRLDDWLHKRLRGPLRLASLDLTGQVALYEMTRGLIAYFLQHHALRSEQIMNQVRQFFSDWNEGSPPIDLSMLSNERIDASVQEYLHYVMLDLALADEELRELGLLQAANIAREQGGLEGFMKILKRDLQLSRRELNALTKQMKEGISA